ncbi:MAG: response regulator [Candidatus Solibacter usitatus]|nr:response regulator [Candidatus Solibacter usitatus]
MPARLKSAIIPTARILLVDDNRSGLMARRVVLEELGYLTDGASDARKALELFRAGQYDLVVTDFRMPGMDGVELIEKLREEKPGIPIVLISGFVDALGLTEKTTGANTVIMKSSNEVQHLIRAAGRLLKTPKKPPIAERSAPPRARKKTAS